jgi:hypothetical protein
MVVKEKKSVQWWKNGGAENTRVRGRYAPLKTERAAFNSLGWHRRGIV